MAERIDAKPACNWSADRSGSFNTKPLPPPPLCLREPDGGFLGGSLRLPEDAALCGCLRLLASVSGILTFSSTAGISKNPKENTRFRCCDQPGLQYIGIMGYWDLNRNASKPGVA
jgi:hypothetical protein